MDIALLLARLLLAATFAVAGVAKLVDLAGSRRAMREFGLPASLAAPLGLLLPLAELAVAGALLPRTSAWWGGVGALALLLVFVAGIGASLARGRQPDCHCFGQLHSAPAGWPTLARNGSLAAVAAFVLWQGRNEAGASAIAWTDDLTVQEAVAIAMVAAVVAVATIEGWVVVRLLGRQGRLLVSLDDLEAQLTGAPASTRPAAPERGLAIGTPAPAFDLPTVDGGRESLDALRAGGKTLLLVFADPACRPCNEVLADAGQWQQTHADWLEIAVIGRGTPDANRARAIEHGLDTVLVEQDLVVAKAYGAFATPAAVLVQPVGTIGSAVAGGPLAIRSLVAQQGSKRAPARTIPLRPTHRNETNGNGRASTAPKPGRSRPGGAAARPGRQRRRACVVPR